MPTQLASTVATAALSANTGGSSNGRFVTGTRAIAKALGCSAMTVVRMIDESRLVAFQARCGKSPWRCRLSEIERIRGTSRAGRNNGVR
jgi:hypothetical protein